MVGDAVANWQAHARLMPAAIAESANLMNCSLKW
jgi:hypothetical protein